MDMVVDQRLRALLLEAARELFFDHGLTLREVDAEPREQEIAGVIGFTGHLRGTVILASKRELIAQTCPLPNSNVGDWTAELANQLLGRWKNRLLGFGIELAMATPVAVRGLHLSCSTVQTRASHIVFSASAGEVVVGLEAVADAPLVWQPRASMALDEGSLELF